MCSVCYFSVLGSKWVVGSNRGSNLLPSANRAAVRLKAIGVVKVVRVVFS
jgi:hypothetical protein